MAQRTQRTRNTGSNANANGNNSDGNATAVVDIESLPGAETEKEDGEVIAAPG